MSRPEFWHCIMSSEIISSIRQDQERYDEDPERYEEEERMREEDYQREQWEMEEESAAAQGGEA